MFYLGGRGRQQDGQSPTESVKRPTGCGEGGGEGGETPETNTLNRLETRGNSVSNYYNGEGCRKVGNILKISLLRIFPSVKS